MKWYDIYAHSDEMGGFYISETDDQRTQTVVNFVDRYPTRQRAEQALLFALCVEGEATIKLGAGIIAPSLERFT